MDRLRRKGYELEGVAEQLNARRDAGEAIASVDLPVICEPENDPSYWRDRDKSSRQRAVEEQVDLPFFGIRPANPT
jgi:hypothetical protein